MGSYDRLDIGLAWRATPETRLELWGQNQLGGGHAEGSGALVPRSAQALVTVGFGH